MTRVLLVSGTVPPDPCGVGDYTFKLAKSLASCAQIETAILTGITTAAKSARGVQVFQALKSWKIGETSHALKILKEWKPDVVHVQYPTQGYGRGWLPYVLPLTARFFGIPTVQTWHEGFGRREALKLFFQLLAGSSKVIVRANFLSLIHPWVRWMVHRSQFTFIANASAIPRAECGRAEIMLERAARLKEQTRLVVFFGFLYPSKGVELLFDIAEPSTDHLVIAGASEHDNEYLNKLRAIADEPRWRGKVTFTGFIAPERAAVLLAGADAVVLPFRQGGGHWNTSIHSATLNGAFVVTTSTDPVGYDENRNVYYAAIDDVAEMRTALARFGKRRDNFMLNVGENGDEWSDIARKHQKIYADLLAAKS